MNSQEGSSSSDELDPSQIDHRALIRQEDYPSNKLVRRKKVNRDRASYNDSNINSKRYFEQVDNDDYDNLDHNHNQACDRNYVKRSKCLLNSVIDHDKHQDKTNREIQEALIGSSACAAKPTFTYSDIKISGRDRQTSKPHQSERRYTLDRSDVDSNHDKSNFSQVLAPRFSANSLIDTSTTNFGSETHDKRCRDEFSDKTNDDQRNLLAKVLVKLKLFKKVSERNESCEKLNADAQIMDSGTTMRGQPDHQGYQSFANQIETNKRPYQSHRRTKASNRNERKSSGDNDGSKLDHHYYSAGSSKQTLVLDFKRVALILLILASCSYLLWEIYKKCTAEVNYLGYVDAKSILGRYGQYAVSTDAEPCAKIGTSLLAKGGSAVDAAIGTLICMGIVIPNSLGIGGGCLMTIFNKTTGLAEFIDGREVAPDYAHENMFVSNPASASRGPLSVGVPGELAAYWKAHQKYGKLKWSELFQDSIGMARNGVPLVEHMCQALRDFNHARYISPKLKEIYWHPEKDRYLSEGELLVQSKLASTLERIRDGGADEFYRGQTGQHFIEDLQRQGGKMTLENLRNYEAKIGPALRFKISDDLTLFTQPVPGSGVVLSVILRIMKELGYYKQLEPQKSFKNASLYYHHLSEAFKFAYAQRAGLEDQPDEVGRMDKLMEKLSSDEFIRGVVGAIDEYSHSDTRYGGEEYFADDHGTAHVSVVDAEGNGVAVTTSINMYFGSGLVSPRTGIVYNDIMDDFVTPNLTNKFGLRPSKYNRIKPGRRPLSSMAPSVFVDQNGDIRLVIGASGGSKITSAIASVALRHLFLGEDIKTSIDGPRIHHQYLPDHIFYENNFSTDILDSLKKRGHKIEQIEGRSSVVMSVANIVINGTNHITANSDYRKGGSVDGV